MNNPKIIIRRGSIDECIIIANSIPEFRGNYSKEEYLKRYSATYHSIWIAEIDGELVGYKTGYLIEDYFYSWLGGVVPKFRNRGIARLLATKQEADCKEREIERIKFKTYNRFKEMLIFALRNGFEIVDVEKNTGKISLEKIL